MIQLNIDYEKWSFQLNVQQIYNILNIYLLILALFSVNKNFHLNIQIMNIYYWSVLLIYDKKNLFIKYNSNNNNNNNN